MESFLSKKSILVTGSSGFIGQALVKALQHCGYNAIPFDIIEGMDVLNIPQLEQALNKADGVIHLGSPSSVLNYIEDKEAFWNTTVLGLKNILSLYKGRGRIIVPSTCTVYGESLFAEEQQCLPEPANGYAAAKLECERLCFLHNLLGGNVKIVRIFTGYGPTEFEKKYPSPIMTFIKDMCGGTSPTVYGNGTQIKDFVFISDIINYIIKAYETTSQSFIFNIGTGVGVSFKEVIKIINKELGTNIEPTFIEKPTNRKFINTIIARNDLSCRELKYTSSTSLEQGVRLTVQAYLNRKNSYFAKPKNIG